MGHTSTSINPRWTWAVPLAAAAVLLLGLLAGGYAIVAVVCLPALIAAVLAAVHHAEVIAHRVGEPLGTLVLALAVTVIEVALILAVMLGGDPAEAAALPRDTIFATIMIIANGVIGLSLLVGALRYREQSFNVAGVGAGFAALITLATLSLILPAFTTSSAGPTYTNAQLAFAAVASLVLWAVFVFGQTVRHREYFQAAEPDDGHAAEPPSRRTAWISAGWLMLTLVTVVGLAKVLSPRIEAAVAAAGMPKAVIGIVIAMLVLLPETWAALRAAAANRIQTSMNLALGSGLASIGLTIPVVAVAAILLDMPLALGLNGRSLVLLVLSFLIGTITLATGRTNLIQGAIHLVVFAAFLFLSVVP